METRDGTASVQSSSTVMMPATESGATEGRDGSRHDRDITRHTFAIVFTAPIDIVVGITTTAGGGSNWPNL